MTQRMAMWLVLLACALVAVLFLVGVIDPAGPADPHPARDAGGADDAMHVDGGDGAAADSAVLVGRDVGDASARTPRGPVLVTVTNPGGHPLAGVPVVLGPAADLLSQLEACRSRVADAEGRVRFADVPYDGSMAVCLIETSVRVATFDEAGVVHPEGMRLDRLASDVRGDIRLSVVARIRGPAAALDSPVGVRYEMRAFDGVTGRRLHAVAYEPEKRFIDHTGAPCRAPLAAVAPAVDAGLILNRDAPEGYVVWAHRMGANGPSPMARLVVMHDPMPPIATVTLSIRSDGPLPELGNSDPYLGIGSRGITVRRGAPDAVGRIPLERVPFQPFARVGVWWELAGGRQAIGNGRFGATVDEPLHVELDLQSLEVMEEEVLEIADHTEWVEDAMAERAAEKPAPALGRFRILRPDGAPGAGAHVWIGSHLAVADREGLAVFDALPPGHETVRVWGAGHVDAITQALVSGAEAERTLHGGAGGHVRVLVKSAGGTPLPFASLRPEAGGRWMDEHEGVHRMDGRTDGQGRRTLHMLPVGPLEIRAEYAGYSATKTVEVVGGKTVTLEIEIPIRE